MSMRLSPVLHLYLARRFLGCFMVVLGALLSVIFLLDCVEMMRGLSKYNNFTFGRAFTMAFFKLPEVGLELLPFAVLIAAVLTFWRLTRTSELVAVRATGVSAWQFLLFPVLTAILIGVVKMSILNPLSTVMLARYEDMNGRYASYADSSVKIARTGLWLRQKMANGQTVIIHAQNIEMPKWLLRSTTAFFFNEDYVLTHRIDSEQSLLKNKNWIFLNAWVNPISETGEAETAPAFYQELKLPTEISVQDIRSRFSSPRTIAFWNLPEYAHIMHDTGFESNPLWAHFYKTLAEPVLNVALMFLAAALTLRSPRQQRGWWLVGGTIAIGFSIFLLGDLLNALGISERLPLAMAAFAPALLTLLMGLTALLYLEDG